MSTEDLMIKGEPDWHIKHNNLVTKQEQNSNKIGVIEGNVAIHTTQLSEKAKQINTTLDFELLEFELEDIVYTKGFKTINDGGNSHYIIEKSENNIIDNCFIFATKDTTKIAKLVINGKVNALSIGFKNSFISNTIEDNTSILQIVNNYLNNSKEIFTIFFPSGWFGFSDNAIISLKNRVGFNIEGSVSVAEPLDTLEFSESGKTGTVFFPINENQNHILKITPIFEDNIKKTSELNSVKKITFFMGKVEIINDQFKTNRRGIGSKKGLILDNVCWSKFEDIIFTGGIAVENALDWLGYECKFNDIMFRDIGKFGTLKYALYIHGSIDDIDYVVPSGTYFNNLDFENIAGPWIRQEKSVDIAINTITGETSSFKNTTNTLLTKPYTKEESTTDIALFEIDNNFGGCNYNNITLQHLGRFLFTTSDNKKFTFNTLFRNVNSNAYGTGINASNISLQGVIADINGLEFIDKENTGWAKSYSTPVYNFNNIVINNDFTDKPRILFNVPKFVLLNRNNIISNTKDTDETRYDIFNKILNYKDTKYRNKLLFNSIIQKHKMVSIPDWYNNYGFTNANMIFYLLTNLSTNEDILKFTILCDKAGTTSKVLRICVMYSDTTFTEKRIDITTNDIRYVQAEIITSANKTISKIFLQEGDTSSISEGSQAGIYEVFIEKRAKEIGQYKFNPTTNMPNWWSGTAWVDANGTTV